MGWRFSGSDSFFFSSWNYGGPKTRRMLVQKSVKVDNAHAERDLIRENKFTLRQTVNRCDASPAMA